MVVSKKLRSPSDHFSDPLSPHVKLANHEIAARRAPRVQLVQLLLWCTGASPQSGESQSVVRPLLLELSCSGPRKLAACLNQGSREQQ